MIDKHKKLIRCSCCHKKIKPLFEKNKLKQNFYGQRFTGKEKNYLLICPNCKAVINSK
jgi:hypothetical protein